MVSSELPSLSDKAIHERMLRVAIALERTALTLESLYPLSAKIIRGVARWYGQNGELPRTNIHSHDVSGLIEGDLSLLLTYDRVHTNKEPSHMGYDMSPWDQQVLDSLGATKAEVLSVLSMGTLPPTSHQKYASMAQIYALRFHAAQGKGPYSMLQRSLSNTELSNILSQAGHNRRATALLKA